MKDKIKLNVPSKKEYISIVRLTASSLANNMDLSVDEIEDIKVCISEACINIVNFSKEEEINILFVLEEGSISIYIDNKGFQEKLSESV